jgi:DNA-binding NarL/FixJ family response regulator
VSISVIIVDDFPLVREGLQSVINAHPGLSVVDTAETGAEGIEKVVKHRPDVVILDLYIPDIGGLRVLADLRQKAPSSKVLMVTASEKAETLLDAVAGGASGYLTKRSTPLELCQAIVTVAHGGSVITPSMAGHLLNEYSRTSRGEEPATRTVLSPREQEVLVHIARGLTDREIAEVMHVSPRTVQNHLMKIRDKTGLRRRSELTHWAVRSALI